MQPEPEAGITRPVVRETDRPLYSHGDGPESSTSSADIGPAEVKPLNRKALVALGTADLAAYLLSFSVVLLLKYKEPLTHFLQAPLLIGLPLAWALSTFLTRKLSKLRLRSFTLNVRAFSLSFFIMLGGVSLLMKLSPLIITSRFAIVSSLLIGYVFELIILRSVAPALSSSSEAIEFVKSLLLLAADLSILASVLTFYLLILYILKEATADTWLLVGSVILGWFASSVVSHQFELDFRQNYWKYINNFIKEYFVFACIASFFVLIFRLHGDPMHLLVGGVFAYAGISFCAFSSLFFTKIPRKTDDSRIDYLKDTEVSDELVDTSKISKVDLWKPIYADDVNITFRDKLRDIQLIKFPGLFSSIDEKVDLNGLNIKYSIVTRTTDVYDVEVLPDSRLQLFMNLQDLNRMRHINSYLIEVNNKLEPDGLFIGRFEPIKNRYNRFLRRYPFYFAQIFYARDFIWHRVFPKLPVFRSVYFAISKGRKRALSIAEAFGRIYYCGFQLASAFELEGCLYFIAIKKLKPPLGHAPLYGPLFKMKRVGENGKNIFVYKIRTMHPYSEYLQEFVYDTNNLEVGGKLKDDFRVTSWGRVLRKLWIDELPMIINLFRGDLKLVGVRPLSGHYLSLYDESLRLRRMKHKPGLIPPFYVDMPKTLDQIMESERRYLDAYEGSPLLTDIKYLFKAVRNIVLRGARSA